MVIYYSSPNWLRHNESSSLLILSSAIFKYTVGLWIIGVRGAKPSCSKKSTYNF